MCSPYTIGWSDFFSLIFTAEPGDKPADIRAVGNYAINAGKDGLGIRRRPYTTDLKFNEFTYKNIDPEVHNLGEVWTTVLWDLYWALSDKYGNLQMRLTCFHYDLLHLQLMSQLYVC